MKIENGLLFLAAYQLSGNPKFYEESCIDACVPIRKISHMKEHPHAGKIYTVLHLDNGDEIIANARIPGIIQLIMEAKVMNLFGHVRIDYFPACEAVVSGSDLKVMLERSEGPSSFAKGGMVPPDQRIDAMV